MGDVGTGFLNNGTINAIGNVIFSNNGKNGTAVLNFTGAVSKTLNVGTTASLLTSTFNIAKTGAANVRLLSDLPLAALGRDFTVSSGEFNLDGYDLAINDFLNVAVGATVRCAGGNLAYGNLSNSGTINCPGFATYDFNWVGVTGLPNWTVGANWQGGSAPTNVDTAFFDAVYCGANCNVTVDANPNVRGIKTSATYAGTITQPAAIPITVGRGGWIHAGGTFAGSNANISIDGGLTVSGGSFTLPTATTTLGTFSCATKTMINYSGGTLAHNNGKVKIAHHRSAPASCHSITNFYFPNGFALYDLEIEGVDSGGWNSYMNATNGTTMNVLNNYYHYGGIVDFNIDLSGNFFVNSPSSFSTTAQIRMMGAGTQEYTYSSGSRLTNKLKIQKASGAVQPGAGNTELGVFAFDLAQGSFTAPSGTMIVGGGIGTSTAMNTFITSNGTTFNNNNGTVSLAYGHCYACGSSPIGTVTVGAGFNFYNLYIDGYPNIGGWPQTITSAGTTLNVVNNFTHYATILNANFTIQGNVTIGPNTEGGNGSITLNGTGAQLITSYPGLSPTTGTWTINKPSGTTTFNGSGLALLGVGQDLNLVAGNVDLNAAVINVKDQLNISPGVTVTCNNGFYLAGTLNNSGTITCPGNYAQSVLTDGAKTYWRFGEPSANYPIGDSAKPGTYRGTVINSGSVTMDVNRVTSTFTDKSLTTSGFGHIDANANIPLAATYTLEAWVKYPFAANGGSWNTLFRGPNDHHVIINRSTMELGMYDNLGPTMFRGSGYITTALSAGWHHLVLIGSGATTTFYIDGVSVGTVPLKSTDPVRYLGNYQGGNDQSFGNVDDIAVYDLALSPAQITDHYNKGKP